MCIVVVINRNLLHDKINRRSNIDNLVGQPWEPWASSELSGLSGLSGLHGRRFEPSSSQGPPLRTLGSLAPDPWIYPSKDQTLISMDQTVTIDRVPH